MTEPERESDRKFDGFSEGAISSLPYSGLPFFKTWIPRPPASAADMVPSPPSLAESCAFKLVMGTVGGKFRVPGFYSDIMCDAPNAAKMCSGRHSYTSHKSLVQLEPTAVWAARRSPFIMRASLVSPHVYFGTDKKCWEYLLFTDVAAG